MDLQRFLQYIGARYVPKFYHNSQNPDSSEWEQNVDYEYMTWVSLPNGNMYLSKENVPASVGSPVDNPRYWLSAGQFNAYIQQLQSDINAIVSRLDIDEGAIEAIQGTLGNLQTQTNNIENELERVKKRNVILIGDSFSYGSIDSQTLGVGWIGKFIAMHPEVNVFYSSLEAATPGVSGFASTRPFLRMLQEIETEHAETLDKDTIDDIVVIGGTNDATYSIAAIESAISAFCSYCKTNYPNAAIKIGVFGAWVEADATVCTAYQKCVKYGASFLYDLWGLMCLPSYISDGTHITQAGYNMFSPYIADSILTGHCAYTVVNQSGVDELTTGEGSHTATLVYTQNDVTISFDNPIFVIDTFYPIVSLHLSDGVIIPESNFRLGSGDCYGYEQATNNWHYVGKCEYWYDPDSRSIKVQTYQILPHATYSTFRDILEDCTFPKVMYEQLS